MQTIAVRDTRHCRQVNLGKPEKIFPLLCPVREAEWIDGWNYRMIHSVSGFAEDGCIFATPAPGGEETIWYVTEYDPARFRIAFLRMTPGEMVVRIRISLHENEEGTTSTYILYEYTALSDEAARWIEEDLEQSFDETMDYWENAINHYLVHGKKLPRVPRQRLENAEAY